ncbi:MAG: flagellar hook-associated protein FlgK, partial [Acidobacteriota bacterium]
MNLFAYFQVGRTALSASQAALDVAGNNIANVNTPGFSRRRLDLTTLFPQRVAGGYIGQGVDVLSLHRVRDNFLAAQIQSGIGTRAGLEARQQTLAGLEAVLGPLDGSPLATALDRLSQALSDVADSPENSGVRQAAVSAAGDLAAQLRSTHDQISRSQQEADAGIAATLPEVNRLTSKIAALNSSIRQIQAAGQEPSDLLDQRDQAVDDLAGLVAIHLVKAKDGSVSVALNGGGGTLVSGSTAYTVAAEPGASGLSSV